MDAEYAAYLAIIAAGTWALKNAFKVRWSSRRVFSAIVPVALVFIAWDVLAVEAGHWSFNSDFLIGEFIGNQPVEEIAFFFIVPLFYAAVWEACKWQTQNTKSKAMGSEKNKTMKQNKAAAKHPGGRKR